MGGAYEGDNFPNVCFENPMTSNNWIVLKLQGVETNRSAIGTKIELWLNNGRRIYHTIGTGSSFGSNSLQAELGVGTATVIDSINVHWQRSQVQSFSEISINRKYKLIEGGRLEVQNYLPLEMKISESAHHHH